MLKRVFREHWFAVTFTAINTLIVVEEFAHQHLYPGKYAGLGWYWTAILSFPTSILWWLIPWPWPSDFLCMLALLVVGTFQWGIIGATLDHWRQGRHFSAKT